MRPPVRGLEKGLTPDVRLSADHLNQYRLINVLWTKVSERSEGVCLRNTPQGFLTPKISRILVRRAKLCFASQG